MIQCPFGAACPGVSPASFGAARFALVRYVSTITYSIGMSSTPSAVATSKPREHRQAHHLARFRPGAGGGHQRHHAENERKRGHQNRAQPQLGGFQSRVHRGMRLLPVSSWRTPRSEWRSWPTGRSMSQTRSAQRRCSRNCRRRNASATAPAWRRTPRTVWQATRSRAETSSHTGRPGSGTRRTERPRTPRRRARGLDLLIRHVGPVIRPAGRQVLRRPLPASAVKRLGRTVSRGGHAREFGGAIQIEPVRELRAGNGPHGDQRGQRAPWRPCCCARRTGRGPRSRCGTHPRRRGTLCTRGRSG